MKRSVTEQSRRWIGSRPLCYSGAMLCLIVGAVMLCPVIGTAANQTVEQAAADIAKRHNAAKITDEMTASSTAEARGKQIVFKNVLRVQKDLSKQKLDEFKSVLQEEIVPKTCMANADNVAFMNMGLYYTFVYFNTYGQKLAEITVDRAAYDKWKALR